MTTTAIDRDTLLRQAYELPLEEIDVSNWHLNENDAHWPYFERLRQEDPIHLRGAFQVRSVLVDYQIQ